MACTQYSTVCIQMSRDKLAAMHMQLDQELEKAGGLGPRSTLQSYPPAPKPPVYQHRPPEQEITHKRQEISDLERKLMELEKKMGNIEVDSDGSIDAQLEQVVAMSQKQLHKPQPPKRKQKPVFTSLARDEDQEEEEDSQDYYEVQKAIQRRKKEEAAQRKAAPVAQKPLRVSRQRQPLRISREASRQNKPPHQPRDKQFASTKSHLQPQSLLRPKYQPQPAAKASVRDSRSSTRRSRQSGQLVRSNSRQSIRSNESHNRSISRGKSRTKNHLQASQDRSRLHSQEVEVVKDNKKMSNLERELMHYKRLTKRQQQQIEDYKVMEIEYKQLQKHLAKSEMIRQQQKKVINALKSKCNQ